MKRRWLFLFLLLGWCLFSQGQEVYLHVTNEPLNKVLTGIRDSYDIQLSFDDELLSRYSITINEYFPSPDAAISKILESKPLILEKNDDVFIIYYSTPKKNKKEFHFSGQIIDAKSGEPLPFSHIKINDITMATDLLGSFNYNSSSDSTFKIEASHLGYYVLDTTFRFGSAQKIKLSPSSIGLKEVVISNKFIDKSTLIGSKPGLMKLNHKIAFFLPGFGDNSVFNLLRLMPGILASGESTNDLIIWGSYAGQSQVIFDGFTIFGLKNFNDNISSFNPLMAKDIEVMKGGFDARYGERVGGIVNITGKNGNMETPSFSVALNNMTLNGMVEIPIAKRASISFSIRHTYYNLYNPSEINSKLNRNNDHDTTNDINVIPDYAFRDLNFKYSQKIGKSDWLYFSLYGGNDKFSYSIEDSIKKIYLSKSTSETNTQLGGSVFYGKTWRSGNTTNFSISYSGIQSQFSDKFLVNHLMLDTTFVIKKLDTKNLMDEVVIKVDNRFSLGPKNTIEFGGGFYVNHVELIEDTLNNRINDIKDTAQRFYSMIQDNIALGRKTVLKVGSRFTYSANLQKWFAEPRISISIQANDFWKFNAAWGLYNQFITKSSIVDELGNYRYLWTIADTLDIPVQKASHYVFGISFHKKGWTISLEPYYKKVNGITRYFSFTKLNIESVLTGESQMYGIDFFFQKDIKGHSAWVSYSLAKVEERWPDLPNSDYRRAPQDQTHEVKLALLLNFDPFYFSTNYVYGSGFPRAPYNPNGTEVDLTYSRWDASFIYKFLNRRVVGEVGLSIMNILNTQNIKYANFERIPTDQTNSINIYAEAIPFTPALYLKFSM